MGIPLPEVIVRPAIHRVVEVVRSRIESDFLQPIEVERISHWNEVNDLTKTGRVTKKAKLGAGDAPNKLLYVQPDNSLGTDETGKISFLPYVHNADSYGYNPDVVPQGNGVGQPVVADGG